MKTNTLITGLTACLLAVSFSACKKNSETPAVGTETNSTTISQMADSAKDLAVKAADATKTAVVAAATNVVNTVAGPFNDGVAAAKKFIADKNYQGALDELNKLSSLKLSDEQTKVVDNLKTEVQALITKGTTGAADAAKSLFGK
jgi:hypothetical protein